MEQQLSELLRPIELSDLIQPPELVQRLERIIETRALPNMLFYGKPGVGKTSAARILIRKFNATAYQINGSMATGIDSIRKDVEMFCANMPLLGRRQICFVDECEYLSPNAQAAMRGLIEKMTHVRFLLTANDISKLQPALKSRCMPVCFDLSPLLATELIERILPRYQCRLASLGYNIEDKRLADLMCMNFPDLRSLANQIVFEYGPPREQIRLTA